ASRSHCRDLAFQSRKVVNRSDPGLVMVAADDDCGDCTTTPPLAIAQEGAIGTTTVQRVEEAGVRRHHANVELGGNHGRHHQGTVHEDLHADFQTEFGEQPKVVRHENRCLIDEGRKPDIEGLRALPPRHAGLSDKAQRSNARGGEKTPARDLSGHDACVLSNVGFDFSHADFVRAAIPAFVMISWARRSPWLRSGAVSPKLVSSPSRTTSRPLTNTVCASVPRAEKTRLEIGLVAGVACGVLRSKIAISASLPDSI